LRIFRGDLKEEGGGREKYEDDCVMKLSYLFDVNNECF
jgi:hypothetical protein